MEKIRYKTLDITKFLAAILICFHHFQQTTGVNFDKVNFWGGKFYVGHLVILFFIISGFLAASKSKRIKNLNFLEYYLQKIKRFIPYSVITSGLILVIEIFSFAILGVVFDNYNPSLLRIFSSFFLCFSYCPFSINGLNNPLWYLCVLLVCYIIFWLVLYISKTKTIDELYIYIIVCILGTTLLLFEPKVAYISHNCSVGYMSFFIGAILYCISERLNQKYLFRFSYLITVVSIILFIYNFDIFFENQLFAVAFICFPSIILTLISIEPLMIKVKTEIFSKLSLNIYVWHSVFLSLYLVVDYVNGGYLIDNCSYSQMLIFVLIVTVFSLIYILLIEKKANRLFERLFNALQIEKLFIKERE